MTVILPVRTLRFVPLGRKTPVMYGVGMNHTKIITALEKLKMVLIKKLSRVEDTIRQKTGATDLLTVVNEQINQAEGMI